jgi:uncharacterized repeat protein (TIGR01451 family)
MAATTVTSAEAKPNPTITSFSPTSGPVGTSVRIFGADLQGTSAVSFNGTAATFTIVSNTQVTATVPSAATSGHIRLVRGQGTATSPSSFTVTGSTADLSLQVGESTDPVVADSTLTYTLSVHNGGPAVANSTALVDTLPAEVMFTSASGAGSYDASAGTVTWNLGGVSAGATVSRTLTITPIHPEFPMSNVASVTTSAPDPDSPNAVTTATTVDPQPGTRYVSVRDDSLRPHFRGLALGDAVQWDFFGPSAHQITDAHGLGLFDTGLQSPISYYRFTFNLSAEVRTKDLDAFPLNTGKISVPLQVSPSAGTTTTSFLVVWALQQPPTGLVQDIQIRRPGGEWGRWRHRQSERIQDQFVPDAGPGVYSFRSRLRNVVNGTVSRLGPPISITVS